MYFLRTLAVTGTAGTILLNGVRTAARLRAWSITCNESRAWTLEASIERVDAFQLRQKPLAFTAPRLTGAKGFWFFPVLAGSVQVNGPVLTANLGPPEQ